MCLFFINKPARYGRFSVLGSTFGLVSELSCKTLRKIRKIEQNQRSLLNDIQNNEELTVNTVFFNPLLRMVERCLIFAGGTLSIYLGYKLFVSGIDKS